MPENHNRNFDQINLLHDKIWVGMTLYSNQSTVGRGWDVTHIGQTTVWLIDRDTRKTIRVFRDTNWYLPKKVPSPEEIEQRCLEVQTTWTAEEEVKRRKFYHVNFLNLHQIISLAYERG